MRRTTAAISSSEEKFGLLDRNMRWEIADLLREQNLPTVNAQEAEPVAIPDTFYLRHGKRAFDVLVASFALLVTLPINIALAVLTLFGLGRPVFFFQQRLGRDGELFTLVKFRNMRDAYDRNGHPLPGHLRVTRLGKLVRRTSLDELLNFWSILRGDMSLVGPRPLVPEYGPRFSARHRQRLVLRPGLECPPRDSSHKITTHLDQFENDIWYAQNVSFRTDIRLIWQLARSVLDRHGSRSRAVSARGPFLGYLTNGDTVSSRNVPEWALHVVLERHGLLNAGGDNPLPASRSAGEPVQSRTSSNTPACVPAETRPLHDRTRDSSRATHREPGVNTCSFM